MAAGALSRWLAAVAIAGRPQAIEGATEPKAVGVAHDHAFIVQAAGSSAVLIPIVGHVLNFLEMIRQYLHSLLDDALDWLTNLISLLDRTLQYLLKITVMIDGLLQLLQDLANLNFPFPSVVFLIINPPTIAFHSAF